MTDKMILIAVGLGLAFILSEGIVRVLGISSKFVYRPSPDFGWSHTPNNHFQWETEDGKISIKINSRGLRDFDYQYEKSPGTIRILILGYSFSEALQVPLKHTFSKRLEALCNAYSGDGEIEGINAGVSGYGTDNALLFFRHEGYKYGPDIVLLAFYLGNDVRNNWYELENIDAGGFRKPYFTIAADGLQANAYPFEKHNSFFTKLKLFLNRHVRLYTLLREARDRLRHRDTVKKEDSIPLDLNVFRQTYPQAWEEAWRITEALIGQLNLEVSNQQAELFVVLIPTRFQVHLQYWHEKIRTRPSMKNETWDLEKPNRLLAEILRREGIRYVDLLNGLREASQEIERELYFANDGHWNSEGHKIAANLIFGSLKGQLLALQKE